MILDEARSYDIYKVPVEESAKESSVIATHVATCDHEDILDEHNQDLGQSVPIFVDVNKSLIDRRIHMTWNEDAKHSDIDA
jgi:hypothetical protein